MKYFFINNSLNNKIVGNYNQVVSAIHHCDVWEDPIFIDRIDFVKIDFEPITSHAILEKKAKLTDLINASCIGFSLRLLISNKLKVILEKKSINKCQFFKSPVIYENEKVNDYWILHPYLFNLDYIDFNKSDINVRVRKKEGGTELIKIQVNSLEEFLKTVDFHKERMEIVSVNKIYLNKSVNEDFFILRHVEGGVKYVVSEKLKQEIEDAGCTGIEFQPTELSYNEWTAPGGEREKVYGKI